MAKQIKKTRKKVTKLHTLPPMCRPRKKGEKDTWATKRRRIREAAALIAELETSIAASGHKTMADAVWWWCHQDPENMTYFMHTYLQQRMTADIDPVQEDILLERMATDVKVAQAETTDSRGGGTQVNIQTGPVMTPNESMRLPPAEVKVIDAKVISDAAPIRHRLVKDVQQEDL